MNTVAQTIGVNVRLLRRSRGLSLVELGRHAGIAKGTLTQLEAGRANPTIGTVTALSDALGVSVRDLVTPPADVAPEAVRSADDLRGASPIPDARLLHRTQSANVMIELYGLRLDADAVQHRPAHPPGVIEQLFVLSGTIEAGPQHSGVRLRPHDVLRIDAGVPHRFAAPDGPASGLLLVVAPASAGSPPTGEAPRPAARPSPPQIPARGVRPGTRTRPHGAGRTARDPRAQG